MNVTTTNLGFNGHNLEVNGKVVGWYKEYSLSGYVAVKVGRRGPVVKVASVDEALNLILKP